MEEQLVTLIGNLGFPIAVASYCLITIKKSNDRMYEVLKEVQVLLRDWKERE